MDCPSCACLIDSRESACPFCDATVRSTGAPVWLTLGLALGVGLGNVSCVVKGDGNDEGTAATVMASESDADSGSSTDSGDQTTHDPSNGDGVTYAGPDETWTASDSGVTTTTGPDPTTTTTTTTTNNTNNTNDTADASTYAGPDETWSASDVSTSSDSSTGSSGDTSGSSGDSSGSSGSTGP